MARRVSGGGRNVNDVALALDVCNRQLEHLARRVQNDCTEFPNDQVNHWKETVLSLAKGSAVAGYDAETAKEVIAGEQGKPREANAQEEKNPAANISKRMMKRVSDIAQEYSADSAPIVKKVALVLKIGLDEEDGEEVQLLGEELRMFIKCLYTYWRIS
jgi:hypothetical protein